MRQDDITSLMSISSLLAKAQLEAELGKLSLEVVKQQLVGVRIANTRKELESAGITISLTKEQKSNLLAAYQRQIEKLMK
jgi:hypothetical protein